MVRRTGKGVDFDVPAVVDALGVDRIIKSLGIKRVIEEVGAKRLIEEIGLDGILASLSPAERRELKRRL